MNMWDEIRKAKSCEECPYKLGLIKTVVSPCLRCPGGFKKMKKEVDKILKKGSENMGEKDGIGKLIFCDSQNAGNNEKLKVVHYWNCFGLLTL